MSDFLTLTLPGVGRGEWPDDIFVRWKPLEQQPIGWAPDLDDGVRLNIRPFLPVPDVGRKGTGCCVVAPRSNGTRTAARMSSAPWYHLGPQYGGKEGDCINDHHLILAEE
jgi:hypothetical protein